METGSALTPREESDRTLSTPPVPTEEYTMEEQEALVLAALVVLEVPVVEVQVALEEVELLAAE